MKVYKQKPEWYSRCFTNQLEHMAHLHFPLKLRVHPSRIRGAIYSKAAQFNSIQRLGPRNRKFLYFGFARSRIYVMQKKTLRV